MKADANMSRRKKEKPKSFEIPGEYRYIAFFELLTDAIIQYREAGNTDDSFRMNRFARASILASALSVECVANCLLISLDTSRRLSEELDRMSPLSKIEVYLKLNAKPALDRGDLKVSKISDLISARNDFVHPKVKGIPAKMNLPQDAGREWIFPFSIDGVHHSQLSIPKVPLFWSAQNAFEALKSISEFYRYLFCTLLNFDHKEMHDLLISRIQAAGVHMPAVYDEVRNLIHSAKEIDGVDFSYFGISPIVVDAEN